MSGEGAIANKYYTTYVKGLFTEATPLNYPENTVQFTQNFRYDPAGYIERRLGLEPVTENGITTTTETCKVVNSYRWESVANRKNLEFIAVQYGGVLKIYREDDTDCYVEIYSVDLETHLTVSSENLDLSPVSMVSGRGSLFVTAGYMNPFRIDYVPANTTTECTTPLTEGFTVTPYTIYERDFEGVEDGIANDFHPTVLSNTHLYNLLNRGWTYERIYQYFDEVGEYPSKSEHYLLGFYTDNQGKEQWSVEELRKISTGSSSASQGHIIRNVFNTCETTLNGVEADAENKLVDVSSITVNADGTVTIKTALPHGLASNTSMELVGGNSIHHTWTTKNDNGEGNYHDHEETIPLDGVHTTYTVVDDRTIILTLATAIILYGDSTFNKEIFAPTLGQLKVESILPKDIPCCKDKARPEVVNFYAGRLWHMTIDSDRTGTNVYFSQVIRNHEDETQAYQDQDPTSRDFNELLKTDGGVISIPEMGNVLAARNLKDVQLLFADNGIWSISGSNDYFNAQNYTISKLTDVGCISKKSVEAIEDTFVYASSRGIYIISGDSRVQSITEQNIHSKYYNIATIDKRDITITYHKYDKTLHVFYGCLAKTCRFRYSEELVLNIRTNAWYLYRYTAHVIADTFATENSSVRGRGIHYLVQDGLGVHTHYMTNCKYQDFIGKEDAIAYLHTAPETLGDLLHVKEIEKQAFFFDNIVKSKCLVNHIWDWRSVDSECKPKGREISFDSPCLVVAEDVQPATAKKAKALSLEFASLPEAPLKLYGWATKFKGLSLKETGRSKSRPRSDRNFRGIS